MRWTPRRILSVVVLVAMGSAAPWITIGAVVGMLIMRRMAGPVPEATAQDAHHIEDGLFSRCVEWVPLGAGATLGGFGMSALAGLMRGMSRHGIESLIAIGLQILMLPILIVTALVAAPFIIWAVTTLWRGAFIGPVERPAVRSDAVGEAAAVASHPPSADTTP